MITHDAAIFPRTDPAAGAPSRPLREGGGQRGGLPRGIAPGDPRRRGGRHHDGDHVPRADPAAGGRRDALPLRRAAARRARHRLRQPRRPADRRGALAEVPEAAPQRAPLLRLPHPPAIRPAPFGGGHHRGERREQPRARFRDGGAGQYARRARQRGDPAGRRGAGRGVHHLRHGAWRWPGSPTPSRRGTSIRCSTRKRRGRSWRSSKTTTTWSSCRSTAAPKGRGRCASRTRKRSSWGRTGGTSSGSRGPSWTRAPISWWGTGPTSRAPSRCTGGN